jgi:hypothetical protein
VTLKDPETFGAVRVAVEGGLSDYRRNAEFPASGLEGHLLRAPLFGLLICERRAISSKIRRELLSTAAFYEPPTRFTHRMPASPLAGSMTASVDST